LRSRLGISHAQLNIIGSARTVGAGISGPIWGVLIDYRGPQPALASAFLNFLIGYSGTRFLYDRGLPSDQTSLSVLSFLFLVLCGFLVGTGDMAGSTTAINTTAKTFPDSARATAVGLVVSGIGLSAFFFSTITQAFFPGDTSHLLLLLTLGTTLPMIIGFFLVRPLPLRHSGSFQGSSGDQDGLRPTTVSDPGGSIGAEAPLLQHDTLQEREVRQYVPREDTTNREEPQQSSSRGKYLSRRRAILMGDPTLTNMFGKKLVKSQDFWLLFVIFGLCEPLPSVP